MYEGGFVGDKMNGFVREGEGSEFGVDRKSALYVGEWKNGLRDGEGNELNENEEVIRRGRWINGDYYDSLVKRYEDGYGNDLSEFDVDCLRGIERLEIGNDCFINTNGFVTDGLNELKSVSFGKNSFKIGCRTDICCCVIMNCDQLSGLYCGEESFYIYETLELKNLPSLIFIQQDKRSRFRVIED